jgi:GNAT superfamily N-acetyltransferase
LVISKTHIIDRFRAGASHSPAEELVLRPGTLADYARLASFHYLRNRPCTATRVLVLEDRRPGIASRFTQRRDETQVVGVLVESLPALSCVLRRIALPGRYDGWADRAAAARLLNAELRCISRVVVHPQWRGLGLAVRLVRQALATMTTPYTEALAAMGRVHPFFKLAGMAEYRRWPLPRDQRLRDALAAAGVAGWELASVARMRDHVERVPWLMREVKRWAGGKTSDEEALIAARDHLLCEPVYYLAAKGEDS